MIRTPEPSAGSQADSEKATEKLITGGGFTSVAQEVLGQFKAAIVCTAVIRACYALADVGFAVTGICSTNTTCELNTTWLYTVIRPIRLYDRITTAIARIRPWIVGYGVLVTTAQLPNYITAAWESRRNFGIVRQAGTISPEGYHGSVVLLDTSAFRVPGSQETLGVVVIGFCFL